MRNVEVKLKLVHLKSCVAEAKGIFNTPSRRESIKRFKEWKGEIALRPQTRHGAHVNKVYETAQTPYQRLIKMDVLSDAKKAELAAIHWGLNPVRLLKQINDNLEQLWRLAESPISLGNRNYNATTSSR